MKKRYAVCEIRYKSREVPDGCHTTTEHHVRLVGVDDFDTLEEAEARVESLVARLSKYEARRWTILTTYGKPTP